MDRKTKYKALSYIIIGNELFKNTPQEVLLKCISQSEAFLAISDTHSGSCGAHQVSHKMKCFVCRQGVYWPTMLKDCVEFARGCKKCQKHGGIQHEPANELHLIIESWPFRGWVLYLIGEINHASSKSHRYVLVGIYYFTK